MPNSKLLLEELEPSMLKLIIESNETRKEETKKTELSN